MTTPRCEFTCCNQGQYGQAQCAFPAVAYVTNDCRSYGWYCQGHTELFNEQAQRRAAIKLWLLSLWHRITG
jgi:hypothetical protein